MTSHQKFTNQSGFSDATLVILKKMDSKYFRVVFDGKRHRDKWQRCDLLTFNVNTNTEMPVFKKVHNIALISHKMNFQKIYDHLNISKNVSVLQEHQKNVAIILRVIWHRWNELFAWVYKFGRNLDPALHSRIKSVVR